jgi:hypothetical protein
MADILQRFKRRIVNYLYSCDLVVWIKIAEFLKLHSKDDDKNLHLLEVPKRLEENDKSKD